MKRLIIIAPVILAVLVAGLLVAPGFVDWNQYKEQITSRITQMTGYDVAIDGDLSMALLPFPRFAINDVTIRLPAPEGGDVIAGFEQAGVSLALGPLFSGNVEVTSVTLNRPVIDLMVDSSGQPTWMTPQMTALMAQEKPEEARSGALMDQISINQVTIRDGQISYTNRQRGQAHKIENVNLSMDGRTVLGPYAVEGRFVYNDHNIRVKANSGRIDKLAESVALQAHIRLPDMQASLEYSGIIAFDDALALQGDLTVQTANPGQLARLAGGSLPPHINKQLSARGLLSFEGHSLAYRNLAVEYGKSKASGHIALNHIGQAASQDMPAFDIRLVFSDKLLLDDILPAPERADAARNPFLPETLLFPLEFTGMVDITAPQAQWQGNQFTNFAAAMQVRNREITGNVLVESAHNTRIDTEGALRFASYSVSTQTGQVTMADPVLHMKVKADSDNPVPQLKKIMPGNGLPPQAETLLSGSLNLALTIKISAREVTFEPSYARVQDSRFDFSGRFKRPANASRDVLDLSVSSAGLDIDLWQKRLQSGAPAQQPFHVSRMPSLLADAVPPIDLQVKVAIQQPKVLGQDYNNLTLQAGMTDTKLAVDGFELASTGGDKILLSGTVGDVRNVGQVDMTGQLVAPDLRVFLRGFAPEFVDRLPAGVDKTDLRLSLTGGRDQMDAVLNVMAMRGTLESKGQIADPFGKAAMNALSIRVKHPNYEDLARLYNPSFRSGTAIRKGLDLFADIKRDGDIYRLSDVQLTLGPADIKGDITADLSGNKPDITADLRITELPLDQLLGLRTATSSPPGGQARTPAPAERWSRDPIDVGWMRAANVALRAQIARLTYGNWDFRNAGINATLKDGKLDLSQLDAGLYGGQIALTGTVQAPQQERQPLVFNGDILAQNVSIEDFVRSFANARLIRARGAMSLEGKIATRGASPSAMIGALHGDGVVNGRDLSFEGFDLAQLSRVLIEPSRSLAGNFTRLFDTAMQGGRTEFDTLSGAYTIRDGTIDFQRLILDGAEAQVRTTGQVNLPLWAMDMKSEIELAEPEDAPILVATFKGPLDQPAKSYAQTVLQQYFQRQIESAVISPLLDRIDESGTLQQLLGRERPGSAPAQPAAPAPSTSEQGDDSGAPAPQQPQPRQQIRPEDAFRGILEGVLGR